jgi:hypothetical protein
VPTLWKSTKEVFSIQGVWHSPNTLPTMVLGQALRIITWQLPIERATPICHSGTHKSQKLLIPLIIPSLVSIVFIYYLICSHPGYIRNTGCWTLSNNQSINIQNEMHQDWRAFFVLFPSYPIFKNKSCHVASLFFLSNKCTEATVQIFGIILLDFC